MLQKLTHAALAAALAFGVAACDGGTDPEGDATTQVRVLLTDAPGNIEAAVVTISEVYLQGDAGRVTLRDDVYTTDLLTLANDTDVLVDGEDVPNGTYGQLRFVVTGAYIEVDNGDGTSSIYATSETYEGLPTGAIVAGTLQTPSWDESGLKVNFAEGDLVLNGSETTWLVDFDVYQSFGQEAGNSGMWVMRPVINGATVSAAASHEVELTLGSGVTLPELEGSAVTLADISAVLTNEDGTPETRPMADLDLDETFEAEFGALLPGTYTLTFTGPAGLAFGTEPAAPITVTVEAGASTTTAATVTSASAL